MKKLSIGNSDFKNTIENNHYFVDKSLLVKEVIDSHAQILLFARPRRFGKTLNLSMLNYFFDLKSAKEPNFFLNLKIWQTEVKENYANYPVIFLSFKDAKANNWNDCYELIISELSDIYTKFLYLLESTALAVHEKQEFNRITNKTASNVEYQRSLKKLSEYLYRYHNQRVVILIDEYDTAIQAGYKNYYEQSILFMRNLLSGAFKDNPFIYKGIISGILRVSRESIFSGLNNVTIHSVLNDEFSDKFGFTKQEVKQILEDFNVATNYELVKKWYNGYKIGALTNIYNPWSILNYAISTTKEFQAFWVNTSSDDLLKEQLQGKDENYMREQLLKLINNETIEKTIEENIVFTDLGKNKEVLWSLLLFSGYLTIDTKTDYNTYTLKIPNYEIKLVFKNLIMNWFNTDLKIRQNQLIETTRNLINNQLTEFETGFKQIIGDTFSYFDTKDQPENVYQSYVLGLLAIIGDDYIIKSNRESGEGRYDILLIPHDKAKYGIVIEIKQLPKVSNEQPNEFAQRINHKISEALLQIDKNKYYNELIVNKIDKIIKLPIVFVGKEPFISKIEI